MVRIVALILFLLLGIYTYETYTGDDFGVRRSIAWLANDGFASGYGMATQVTSTVFGIVDGFLGY